MVTTVTDDDQRVALMGFIDDTRRSIHENTSAVSSIVSSFIQNMDVVTGVMTASLSESPILGMIAGFLVNQVKGRWEERQESKYAVQEARERLLSEDLKIQIAQEKLLSEMTDSLDKLSAKEREKETPQVAPIVTNADTAEVTPIVNVPELEQPSVEVSPIINVPDMTPEPVELNPVFNIKTPEPEPVELNPVFNIKTPEPEPVDSSPLVVPAPSESPVRYKGDDDSESTMWLEGLHDLSDTTTMEVMQIGETLTKFMDTNDTHLEMIEELIQPLVSNTEENRRENAVYQDRLIDALANQSPVVVGEDGKEKDSGFSLGSLKGMGKSLGRMAGGLLGSLTKMGGALIKNSLKFFVRMLPKVISKIFVPALIIGSLFSGVMEAIDVYTKTGSIKDAAIGFFGGILDFVTFGFFGTEELNNVIDYLAGIVDPLIETMKRPFMFMYNAAVGWTDDLISWVDDLMPSMDDLSAIKGRFVAKVVKFKDGLVEKIMSPINKMGEIFDSLMVGFKVKLQEWVSAAPDWMVPESLSTWLSTPTTDIALMTSDLQSKVQLSSMPEAEFKARQTEDVIKQSDKINNTQTSQAPSSNTSVIDNSRKNTTIIQAPKLTTADPELSARMAQMNFNSGGVGL
jgi:hypothetical protein